MFGDRQRDCLAVRIRPAAELGFGVAAQECVQAQPLKVTRGRHGADFKGVEQGAAYDQVDDAAWISETQPLSECPHRLPTELCGLKRGECGEEGLRVSRQRHETAGKRGLHGCGCVALW